MSHELRTPLNSMLILSKLLAENSDNSLSAKQIEFAQTIYSSGADLLGLINDILDMAKIESGMMSIEATEVRFADLRAAMEQTFQQVASDKGLEFTVEIDPALSRAIYTDGNRCLRTCSQTPSSSPRKAV
jgi:signal transduction histidine kinase